MTENAPKFEKERTLIIGDTLKSDMVFGKNAGYSTLFVGTGVSTMKDIEDVVEKINDGDESEVLKKMVPDYCITSLEEFHKKFSKVF